MKVYISRRHTRPHLFWVLFSLAFASLASTCFAQQYQAASWQVQRSGQAVPVRMQAPRATAPSYRMQAPVRSMTDSERLIVECYRLSRAGLRYDFGSNDPGRGGLDCSGAMQHLLTRLGLNSVPRTAYTQYQWLSKARTLRKIPKGQAQRTTLNSPPGTLLFWSGTYRTSKPITHVMVYVGPDRRTGKPIIFGARGSKSRGMNGNGVDFFEFTEKMSSSSKLVAVAQIPGFRYR